MHQDHVWWGNGCNGHTNPIHIVSSYSCIIIHCYPTICTRVSQMVSLLQIFWLQFSTPCALALTVTVF